MAVCLRLAAGGSVAGVGESALRALSKLDQVMPARLRSQVSAVHDSTVTLTSNQSDSPVEPDVLMTLARACRDHEHVAAGYVDLHGNATQRRLEPYQLVTTGRRWYLLCLRPRPPGLAQPAPGPDGRRPGARQHVHPAGGARRGHLRAAVDLGVAVPLHGARPLSRAARTPIAQVFSPASVDIEPDGSRRVHRHHRGRRPRADGARTWACRGTSSRCCRRRRWSKPSVRSPTGSAGPSRRCDVRRSQRRGPRCRRGPGLVRRLAAMHANAGAAAARADGPGTTATAGHATRALVCAVSDRLSQWFHCDTRSEVSARDARRRRVVGEMNCCPMTPIRMSTRVQLEFAFPPRVCERTVRTCRSS